MVATSRRGVGSQGEKEGRRRTVAHLWAARGAAMRGNLRQRESQQRGMGESGGFPSLEEGTLLSPAHWLGVVLGCTQLVIYLYW
jgi:hypothetical protein